MQHLQSIPTCEDIVEETYLWEEDFLPMTSCWQSVGLDTSWKIQDNVLFPGQQDCDSFGTEWEGFKQ